MASQPKPHLTPGEYLALERRAETKNEYHDGEIVALAGASREHNLIVGDVNAVLIGQFRGRGCETYTSDMRVRIPTQDLYCYPDIVVVCGPPQFEDTEVDTLLNPGMIIEVLSHATERYDRSRKFAQYRTIPMLTKYVLIAQDEPRIDYYRRDPDGRWFIGEAYGHDATLTLAIGGGCTLALADIYARVTLPGQKSNSPKPAHRCGAHLSGIDPQTHR